MSLGPELATVFLALGAALAWGFSDFGGGVSSRRAPVFGVVLVVQVVGAVLVAGGAQVRGEPLPSPSTIGLAAMSGLVGAGAIVALYEALSVGRMGVVAPLIAVLGAAVPVLVGLALLGPPGGGVVLGFGLGIVAIVLVARVPGRPGGRSGLPEAAIAGALIGVFNVLVSRFPAGEILWPLAVIRSTSVVTTVLVITLARRPWRVPRSAFWVAVVVGAGDVLGNALYITATQTGRLDVAAIVSSLYPVVTVVLAVAILRERLTRSHAAGVVAAAAAIALIAAG